MDADKIISIAMEDISSAYQNGIREIFGPGFNVMKVSSEDKEYLKDLQEARRTAMREVRESKEHYAQLVKLVAELAEQNVYLVARDAQLREMEKQKDRPETLEEMQTQIDREYEALNTAQAQERFAKGGEAIQATYQNILKQLFIQGQKVDFRLSDLDGSEIMLRGEPVYLLGDEKVKWPSVNRVIELNAGAFTDLQGRPVSQAARELRVGPYVFQVGSDGMGGFSSKELGILSGTDTAIAEAALAKASGQLEDARIAAREEREGGEGAQTEIAQVEPENTPTIERTKPEGLSEEVLAALNQTESEKYAKVAQAEPEKAPKGQKMDRETLPQEIAKYLAEAEKGGDAGDQMELDEGLEGTYHFVNPRYIVEGKPVKEEQYVAAVKANETAAKTGGEQTRVKRVFDVYFEPEETTQKVAAAQAPKNPEKKKG
jgi:hypothetical protein